MKALQNLSRRDFLGGLVSSGGLLLGTRLGMRSLLRAPMADKFEPDLFLSIDADGLVTIIAHRSEMGTGIRTALPLVVAEELDADLDRIRIEQATGDARLGDQNTDGSKSIRDFYQPMREVGAAARTMLEQAAAEIWVVPVSECAAREHGVRHAGSERVLDFGELVEAASKQPVPAVGELSFKAPADWRYVGKPHSIVDARDLTTGKARFGLDVTPEGCVVAMVARSPVLGGRVAAFDDEAARAVRGVIDVVELPAAEPPYHFQALGGIAVIAKDTWAAKQGRDVLVIEWSESEHGSYDSTAYRGELESTVAQPGEVVRSRGEARQVIAAADARHEALYYLPHLAHASMEPPAAVAIVTDTGCELWAPVQNPQEAQTTVADALGIDPATVTCHVTLLGGGFGRKSKPDFCAEAALLSRQLGKPVKIVWTREDDIRHDYYHSVAAIRMEAALDADGKPTAWLQRTAFPTISSTFDQGARQGSIGELSLGFTDLPYDLPNLSVEVGPADSHVRIGWLRSVSNVFHVFAVCSFTDELAVRAGQDPLRYTLDLIGEPRQLDFDGAKYPNYGQPLDRFPADTGRLRAVAELCAERASWGKELPRGRGQGFAVCRSFLSYVAVVVEVEVSKSGKLSIPRVDIAIDCGLAVSPDRVRAQMEGSVIFGQSIAMFGEITAKDGAIEQDNFDGYRMTRMHEAAREIHVHLVESTELPAGVGEPGVPPMAPAICAAIAKATGKRVRDLPLSKHELGWS